MKLVHRLLNSGWFHVVAASFGWIIHDPFAAPSAKYPAIEHAGQAGRTPPWGLMLYGIGIVCGLVGIVLNFSGSLQVGTPLIVVAIALSGSTALQLGHLKVW